jgi:hypothetical protein
MEKVELEIEERTLERARRLAASRHCSLGQLVSQALDQLGAPGHVTTNLVLGVFADEPELMDQVVESAMVAREQHPLRHAGG